MVSYSIVIFAHNEEKYIEKAIESVLEHKNISNIHVLVNGSKDKTAHLARQYLPHIHVHEYQEGGKANTWNRFILDKSSQISEYYIIMDGDAYLKPNSIFALIDTLKHNQHAYIASALPMNGRNKELYKKQMIENHGLFGDCYAIRGTFIKKLQEHNIRLPSDLIGDDGLIGALAKIDCTNEDNLDQNRVVICTEAGFYCHPFRIWSLFSWKMQYKRMLNYSLRFFQNTIITHILRTQTASALPKKFTDVYIDYMPILKIRTGINYFFDKKILKKIKTLCQK